LIDINEIKDLLRKLSPLFGNQTKALWYLNLLSKDSKSAYSNRELTRLLVDKEAKCDYQKQIRLPPPSLQSLKGEYHVGNVIYPNVKYSTFGLQEDEFLKHILIVGMTGTGKTNLTLQILQVLGKKKKPFLIFDWKRNYQKLKKLPCFHDLKVIRIADKNCSFRFNPLIPPPGVHPKHWLALIIDVIKHAFFVAHGPEYFFRKGIDELYGRFKVYEGNKVYPTFGDLQKILGKESVRGREGLWMSSSKRVLSVLTFSGLLGDILNVREQGEIEELLNGNVVLELDNLATLERIFLTESLLLWLYYFRKNQGPCHNLRHVTVIEEAHHILSEKKESQSGEESVVEQAVRMIREFGEGMIVVDQEPSKLSKSIMANTNSKVCFNLGSGLDVRVMAEAMNLDLSEKDSIDKLKVGHGIVKTKHRFFEPIHIRFPLVEIEKLIGKQAGVHSLNKLTSEMLKRITI